MYFILSEEDKSTDASLDYWFRCVRLAGICVLLSKLMIQAVSGEAIFSSLAGLLVPVRPEVCLEFGWTLLFGYNGRKPQQFKASGRQWAGGCHMEQAVSSHLQLLRPGRRLPAHS